MTNSDVILRLVEMLLAEKDKNFTLQVQQVQQQKQDEKLGKD